MRILITGGAGFLGSALVPLLVNEGYEIFALSRSVRSSQENNLTWIQNDLSNGLNISKLPSNIDGVIHLAQSPDYRNGPNGEENVFQVNVASHAALLRYAENANAKVFVSASTGSVYEPFDSLISEGAPVNPTGFYGASKLAAEIISGAYSNRMAICNLRVFFLYGPGQKNMFISRLIETIKTGGKVTIPTSCDGLIFVPTLHSDVAKVFKLALEKRWEGTYNVSNPVAVSLKKVAETIATLANVDLNLERVQQTPPVSIIPSLEKLSNVFELSDFTNLEDGISKTLDFSD